MSNCSSYSYWRGRTVRHPDTIKSEAAARAAIARRLAPLRRPDITSLNVILKGCLRMTARPILFLIDGSNQMYRAYHAIRGLTGPDGRSTNAVYGFVTMLRKLIADHDPKCIAAAFDLSGPTFRFELRDDYKANRSPMPSDLAEQIPFVHRACEALGVQGLTFVGFEADDVIGTLARQAAAQGRPVAIVTGDKDF